MPPNTPISAHLDEIFLLLRGPVGLKTRWGVRALGCWCEVPASDMFDLLVFVCLALEIVFVCLFVARVCFCLSGFRKTASKMRMGTVCVCDF